MAKNQNADRAAALAQLATAVPYFLALTGTPLENRAEDLWHVLHLIDPDGWPDHGGFVRLYGNRKRREIHGRVFHDDQNESMLPELRVALRGVMIRRLKTDVLADLPEKTRTLVAVDLPVAARAAYDAAEAEMPAIVASSLRSARAKDACALIRRGLPVAAAIERVNATAITQTQLSMLAFVVLGHLRRLVGQAKIGPAVAWIEDFAATGQPLVVFVAHRMVGDGIQAALMRKRIKWARIDGSVKPEDRGAIVSAFQAGQIQVVVCGIRSASTGITLTRASHMLIVERDLVPAVEEQAEDRLHRLGQRAAVNIYYLTANDTIDDRLNTIAATKRRIGDIVLGAETVAEADAEMDAADPRLQKSQVGGLAVAWFARRVEGILSSGVDDGVTVDDVRAAWNG